MLAAFFPRFLGDRELLRMGEPEIVLKFFRREKFGAWKETGMIRYLEVGHLKIMLSECDSYMQQLILGK